MLDERGHLRGDELRVAGIEGYVDGYGPTSPPGADVWIAGRPVDPSLPMTVSPLREGAMVGLGGPVGLGVPAPDDNREHAARHSPR